MKTIFFALAGIIIFAITNVGTAQTQQNTPAKTIEQTLAVEKSLSKQLRHGYDSIINQLNKIIAKKTAAQKRSKAQVIYVSVPFDTCFTHATEVIVKNAEPVDATAEETEKRPGFFKRLFYKLGHLHLFRKKNKNQTE